MQSKHQADRARLLITRTRRGRIRPTRQPIRQVRNIARRSTSRFTQVPRLGNVATVVTTCGGIGAVVVIEILHEAVAFGGALGAVLDHVVDGLVGVLGVEVGAVVGLHKTWVGDAVVCCFYAGAAG